MTEGRNNAGIRNGWSNYKMVANVKLDEDEETWTGEAPVVLPMRCGDEDYYYLFWTWGKCCRGTESTYETVMGRSTDPFGPYLDKEGKDMAVIDEETDSPGGSYFLRSAQPTSSGDKAALGTRYIGPGHVGFFEHDDGVVANFHFYDGLDGGDAKMGARRVKMDAECWPYVESTTWSAL